VPEHTDKGEYNNRMPKPGPMADCCGYPNRTANTQTMKTRGTGAATRGTKSSSKLG
jgi:hypothetical protein